MTESELLIGQGASALAPEIIRRNPDIDSLFFAQYHPGIPEIGDSLSQLSAKEILQPGYADRLLGVIGPQTGLLSIVRMNDGTFQQIPMTYIVAEENTEDNLSKVREFIRYKLYQKSGWIVSAEPNSFYYCGNKPISVNDWLLSFLRELRRTQSQAYSGIIVPQRYLDLALAPRIRNPHGESASILRETDLYLTMRISGNPIFPSVPKIVGVL